MVAISDEVLFADEEVMVIIQLPKLQETNLAVIRWKVSADKRSYFKHMGSCVH